MMTDAEKLAIAIEALTRFADKKNIAASADSCARFGSGGAYLFGEGVQKYAEETLAKIRG
ncbi:MAG: hypothetical protein ABI837_08825 [Acidobacteriota bacterium]